MGWPKLCDHSLKIWEEADRFGFWIQHGSNEECRKFFAVKDQTSYGVSPIWEWLRDVHEYDKRTGLEASLRAEGKSPQISTPASPDETRSL